MRKYNIFTIALLLFSMVGFVYAQGVIENPTIGDITTTNPITMKQQGTTPSNPISGYNKIYMKSDGLMYKLNSTGTEAGIASGTLVSSDLTEALKTPPAIGGTTPAAGTFTTVNTTGDVTIGSTTAGKNLTVYGTGTFTFATGVDVVIGRGTTDTDITYIALRSANGTKFYIYPDDSGALTTSTTAP